MEILVIIIGIVLMVVGLRGMRKCKIEIKKNTEMKEQIIREWDILVKGLKEKENGISL